MAFIFEHRVERDERSVDKASQKGKIDEKKQGRELALSLGRIIISKIKERQKKKGEKAAEEKVDPLDISISDLRQQQDALLIKRKEFEKRFSNFKEKEKETLKKLEPFKDGRRELLRQALAFRLTDFDSKENKKTAPKIEKAYEQVLFEFDEHFQLSDSMPIIARTKTYLSAYTVLQQERILKTEDQLNGTREQNVRMTQRVFESLERTGDLLNEQSTLALALRMIIYNKRMQAEEKAHALRSVIDAVEDQRERKILRTYIDALESYALNSVVMRQKAGSLEYALRGEQECLSRMQEEHRMKGELINKEGGGDII